MSGCGFPLFNRECDRIKACGCGGFGGCDSGCNSGHNQGCSWGGKFGKHFHKGRGCNKGCDSDNRGCDFGDLGGFGDFGGFGL